MARFSASESLRVYPNIYKNSPPFASSKGFPLVGFAMRVRERESASDSIISIKISTDPWGGGRDLWIDRFVFWN